MKNKLTKITAFLIALAIPVCSFPVNGSAATAPETKDSRGRLMAGEFISCDSVEPQAAKTVANNKGMSGLSSYIHLHNTDESNSYKSDIAGKKGAVTFSFSQIEPLGYMYIWNYNVDGQLDSGMKDVTIQYSVDKQNWFDLDSFELAKALESENEQYGGNAANNINDGYRTPVNFGGLPVKYVRIIPHTNYGGNGYGLSEVRFFRFKTRPNKGSLISSAARAPQSDANAVNLTNSYGLSDLTSPEALHTNRSEAMWLSEKSAEDSFVVINLDGTYPVDSMALWNYNNADNLNSGMQKIKIEYTTKQPYSSSDSAVDYSGGEWTLLGEYMLPKGTGEAGMPKSLSVDFKNVQAQHIRITPLDNYGGSGYGLSAVRVFAGTGWAVEPSRDWSQLFSSEGSFDYQTSGVNKRDNIGWILADGVYTLNMNGADKTGSADSSTKTVFMFSDTLMGNLANYQGSQGRYGNYIRSRSMNNNSFAALVGNKPDPRNFQFYLNTSDNTQSILGNGNWAQELLRIDDKMYAWSFPQENWSATKFILNTFDLDSAGMPSFISNPPAKDMNFLTEYEENGTKYRIEFSGAVMDNTESGGATPNPDGYIYMYGIKSFTGFLLYKSPVVARVKPEEFDDLENWRYWNGSEWVEDVKQAAVIDGGDGMVSNEFSVSYMDSGTFAGKYVMNFTNFTQSTMLAMSTSDTPYGTFDNSTNKIALYDCPEALAIRELNGDNGIYTYNAKAHPHLSADGELLISYNLNSRNFDTRYSFEFLHPHFVTLFDVKESSEYKPAAVSADGENISNKAEVTANSEDESYSAANAVDGDINTYWLSEASPDRNNGFAIQPAFITLDFNEQTAADKFVVSWGSGYAKKAQDGYRLEYSNDGVQWDPVPAVYSYGSRKYKDGVNCTVDTVKFEKITARYFRIYMTKASNVYAPSIREIEVYDSSAAKVPEPQAFIPVPKEIGALGETDTDYSALTKLVSDIEALSLVSSQYTKVSWDKFYKAFSDAKTALQSVEEAAQEQVDSLVSVLDNAYKGLVKYIAPDPGAGNNNNNTNADTNKADVKKPSVKIKNGWVRKNGKEYYYRKNKLVKNAWVKVKSKTYRTDRKGAKIKSTRWITVKNKRYRLVKGVVQKNKIIRIGSKRYYVNKKGVLRKNTWIKFKRKWYRAKKSGILYSNTSVKIKGKKYRFNKKAVCLNR